MVIELLSYISLLLSSLFLISRYIIHNREPLNRTSPFLDKLIIGCSYGFIGACLMYIHRVLEGNIADPRQILVLLAVFYGGWIPVCITILVISVFRYLLLDGGSLFTSVVSMLLTAGIAQLIMWSTIPRPKQWYLITLASWMEIYLVLWLRVSHSSGSDPYLLHFSLSFILGSILAFHFAESLRKSYGVFEELRRSKEQLQETVDHLQKTTKQLESFIQHSADPVAIFDINHQVTKINPAFESVFGWTESEILGSPPPYVPLHEINTVDSVREKALRGETVSGYNAVRLCKDGSPRIVNLTVSPIRDINGEVVGYSSVFRDITEQKAMEDALSQSEANYRLIAEHSSDLIAVLNIHAEALYLSPSHVPVLGIKPEEYIGRRMTYRVHKEDYPSLLNLWTKALEERKQSRQQYRYKHANGSWLWIESQIVPVLLETGDVEKLVITSRDVTERKQTEELLRDTEKLSVVGELAAGIAHEIRNPLTTLIGFAHLMKSDPSTYQPFYLKLMHEELNRIDSITNELLYLAKPQVQEIKEVNIRGMLEQITTLLTPQALLYDIMINVRTEDELPTITCVESRLKQVFINLIKNAIEAMQKGGEILIVAKQQGLNTLYLAVKDQGTGIPEERMEKLGQPFYSLKEKGTGLGLTVCKKIIQEHNGSMTFHSELGVGTVVEIRLPRTTNFFVKN